MAEAKELTEAWIIWIPTIIAFFVVISLIVIIISLAVQKDINIEKIQQPILRQRFLYSENCLAYKQDRVYPGIIDLAKFNEKRLQDCFNPNDKIGAQLVLKTDDYIKTANINPILADKFNFCFDEERFSCSNYTYYVLINNNSIIEPGLLDVALIKLK
ncbi:MAG: hypothetical protein AABX55_02365 [Nanoarchaeota archaeon]